MHKRLRRYVGYIGSRRFAIILLVITTSIILVGNLLPHPLLMTPEEAEIFIEQRPFLYRISRSFHVMNITKSSFFLVVPLFILLSVSICTYNRVRGMLKRQKQAGVSQRGERSDFDYSGVGVSPERVAGILSRSGWKTERWESGDGKYISCRRGEGGFWGSVVFHAGLNIIILGAIVTSITAFNGRISMTEGFDMEPVKNLRNLLSPKERELFPYKRMLLQSFEARYENEDFPVDYVAKLKVLGKKGMTGDEIIRMNRPLFKEGFQFVFDSYYFTPRFTITDREGDVVEDAFVNLLLREITQTDEFSLPSLGIRIKARFFPDFHKEGDLLMTRSKNLNNPAFLLEFYRGINKLGDGILRLNRKMDFDKGRYTIEFKDLRRWITVEISRDLGLPFVKFGFFVIVLGLSIRFLLNEKRIWFSFRVDGKESRLDMGGKALYFPALFEEEMRRMAEDLGLDPIER